MITKITFLDIQLYTVWNVITDEFLSGHSKS